jgi:hypothetical protein
MVRVKTAVAAATFASVSLLSFGWSAHQGVSLAVAAAQAARHSMWRRIVTIVTATASIQLRPAPMWLPVR